MNTALTILLWATYFIALYFVIFWILVFLDLKHSKPKDLNIKHHPFVSIIVPSYNEATVIKDTIMSIVNINYPKNSYEAIVVNDGSTDNTKQVVESIIKDNPNIALINQHNQGKAAALNNALKIVKGEFFVCLDADSTVEPDTLRKMLALYQHEDDDDLAIITPAMKVKKPVKIIQKFQRIEYIIALFVSRLMSRLDCLYVAPGPFSLYNTAVIKNLGGFDETNLTEDMEIAYRAQQNHYKIKHCHDAYVYTSSPKTLRDLYKQRNRWFKGGISNALKYRKILMNRNYGDFGFIQMSVNILNFFLCTSAIFFFGYYLIWPVIKNIHKLYLVNFDIMPLLDFNLNFNFLSLDISKLVIVLTILFISITVFFLSHRSAKERIREHGLLHIVPYFLVYYIILSFVAMVAAFELIIGKKQKW